MFDEKHGILVSFFPGYFKMFEPINFKQVWSQSTEDIKIPAATNVGAPRAEGTVKTKRATFVNTNKKADDCVLEDQMDITSARRRLLQKEQPRCPEGRAEPKSGARQTTLMKLKEDFKNN